MVYEFFSCSSNIPRGLSAYKPEKLVVYCLTNRQFTTVNKNKSKNPNWQEADQLAIYKCGRGVEIRTTEPNSSLVVRAELEPATSGLQIQLPDHSTTLHAWQLFYLVLNKRMEISNSKSMEILLLQRIQVFIFFKNYHQLNYTPSLPPPPPHNPAMEVGVIYVVILLLSFTVLNLSFFFNFKF